MTKFDNANLLLFFIIHNEKNEENPSGNSSFNVRMKGLEPPRPETSDPKSDAATNYATCARNRGAKLLTLFPISKFLHIFFGKILIFSPVYDIFYYLCDAFPKKSKR